MIKSQGLNKKSILIGTIFVVFGLIYSLISLVNHYTLRTYALDLGVLNQALNDLSHFQSPIFTLGLDGKEYSIFSDHFSPLIILLTPFYYLFGSWTGLLVQIASILLGGWGVYQYVALKNKNSYFPIIMLFQFFGIWGIYSALSFDFHTNVLAAMMVPWLLYYYDLGNKKAVLLFTILILLSKENMALWLAFIFLGLMFKNGNFKFKEVLKFEIPTLLLIVTYFVVVIKVVMPFMSDGQYANPLNRYSHLGQNMEEIISTLFTEPLYVFSLFFESPMNDSYAFGVNSELHFMVLVSGGIAVLYRPYYLLMLIPIYAQKFFTNEMHIHSINGQYSIEFVPILSLAIVDFANKFSSTKKQLLVVGAFALSTHFFNFNAIEHRKSAGYDPKPIRYYYKKHYTATHTLTDIQPILDSIPKNAIVCSQGKLIPHLCDRKKVYMFPIIKNSDYIFIDLTESNTYPLTTERFQEQFNELKSNGEWEIFYEQKDHFLVLKRK